MGKKMKLKLEDLEVSSFVTVDRSTIEKGGTGFPRPTRENTCANEETFGTCCIEPPPGHTNLGCGTVIYSFGGNCPTGAGGCTGQPGCI